MVNPLSLIFNWTQNKKLQNHQSEVLKLTTTDRIVTEDWPKQLSVCDSSGGLGKSS